ncbi:50S ribosomal protein L18 [Pontiella sp.]|uniref:50S ribosomal protein L18 n=1 Tax=Pontiella sp. TaxID=2837462 RepID=UPI0035687E03
MATMSKKNMRIRRHLRVRNKISGTAARPRMAFFRSNKRMEIQFIDDDARLTICGVSCDGKNAEAAKALGAKAAEAAKGKGIETVVFDRGGFAFGSNLRTLADSAREAGLKF